MKNLIAVIIFISLLSGLSYGQNAKRRPAAVKPAASKTAIDPGTVTGHTYANKTFNLSVTFPESWSIPNSDMKTYLGTEGIDLTPKVPAGLTQAAKTKLIRDSRRVILLLTAYKYLPGMENNAYIRISAENLSAFPQIKDAVDYIDAMRVTFKAMPLPAGFKYSETQAEKLGMKQFAYIDTETAEDKRRLYATVRNGYAIMFSISYTEAPDLEVLRQVLTDGDFALK